MQYLVQQMDYNLPIIGHLRCRCSSLCCSYTTTSCNSLYMVQAKMHRSCFHFLAHDHYLINNLCKYVLFTDQLDTMCRQSYGILQCTSDDETQQLSFFHHISHQRKVRSFIRKASKCQLENFFLISFFFQFPSPHNCHIIPCSCLYAPSTCSLIHFLHPFFLPLLIRFLSVSQS